MDNERTSKSGHIAKFVAGAFFPGLVMLVIVWAYVLSVEKKDFNTENITWLHLKFPSLFIIDMFPVLAAIAGGFIAKRNYVSIEHLEERVSSQVANTSKTAKFAQQIGKGEFNVDFQPYGEDDVLGKALLDMRNSLLEANKKEIENTWIINGKAETGEILRANNDLKGLSEQVIAFITRKADAIQGAFYVVNDDNASEIYIEMIGSYAYNKKKYLRAKFAVGQGLVGQSVIEQDTIYRTEIPNDYATITSGLLGDRKPKSLLIVPLITNEKVFGAIELASFNNFTPAQIKFVQELSDILARTIFNVRINEKTVRLLNESQTMAQELSEQREQLLQNAEEMRATQEEITRTNVKLAEQIEEVNKSQQRIQVLLENASEIINIYDETGIVKYASPSVLHILGYSPDDLTGRSFLDIVHPKGKETVQNAYLELLNNPRETVRLTYSILKPDGTRVWLESTARNLIDNAAINGLLFNTINITERRKAEKEQRERAKMQALSENSPDIILRFDLERRISYINPAIKHYTGLGADLFLHSPINELLISKEIVAKWNEILDTVKEKNDKYNDEMPFTTERGKLYMEVNAIPEFGETQLLESTLMVLHDITAAKEAEHEIQEKNKKITESINYARRIQASILPKEIVLKTAFPKSFMLFLPRDIVSGDFPFVFQRGRDVYVSAVDCTGHGVPGAMLSIIGSLILNEVMRNDCHSASVLCDKLHGLVVKTLRQGEEGSENDRDGMDIAMCRINVDSGEMEFAGAHRPLYILRKTYKEGEELEELKGDKYPIGGVQYKGREVFSNYQTKLGKGDRIYMFSDGMPDQFGGPNKPLKKFGPKRIRENIITHRAKAVEELKDIIKDDLMTWKGDEKQMDDILLIGVEF